MLLVRFLAWIGLALLAACASPSTPSISPELIATAAANPGRSVALMQAEGERLAEHSFVGGNKVDLLRDGPASFAALAEAIRSARFRIDLESYEFDDVAGAQFADMLLAARDRNVEVNLIRDAWGTADTSAALFERLRQGGVRVLTFDTADPNRRDHRKLLCVDGRVCITGGVNITKVYENAPKPPGGDPDEQAWRDTDVRLEGPVAAQFERFYVATWKDQHGPPIAPPPAVAAMAGAVVAQAIDGAPGDGQPLIYRTLIAAIALAQRSIHLTTGYFIPPPDFAAALKAAARRGVDVQLVVPHESDSGAAVAAGRAEYGDLLEAGVKIHERLGRVLHAKTAVLDGAWSAVGSSNLDWRSAIWNNEIDAIILGPEFGTQMEAMFRDDVAQSHTVTLEAWRRRGLGERLRELRAKIVETLL